MMLYEWLCDNDFILEDGGVYMVIEFLYINVTPPVYDVAQRMEGKTLLFSGAGPRHVCECEWSVFQCYKRLFTTGFRLWQNINEQ